MIKLNKVFLLSVVLPIGLLGGNTFAQAGASGTSTFEPGLTTDQALCRQTFPSQAQMLKELQAMALTNATTNAGVGGLAINNENPQLIKAYRFLTSYKTYRFKVDRDMDNWHIFKTSDCHKALCAAQTIYGEETGILYLYIAAKYGLVLSHLGFDRLKPPTPQDQIEFDAYYTVRPWDLKELVPYLRALPMLPPAGLPLPMVRFTHSGIVNPMNANVLGNGIIQFYSPMDTMSDSAKEQSTYHEIGHQYGQYYNLERSKEWIAASGWKLVDGHAMNPSPEKFVSEYAKKDLFEDFAESFTYYRYYPHRLKERSPERYAFLKDKVYLGREFLSEVDCRK